jgi:hypothetical protein
MHNVKIILPADVLDPVKLKNLFEIQSHDSVSKEYPPHKLPYLEGIPDCYKELPILSLTLHIAKGPFRQGAGCSVHYTVVFVFAINEKFSVDSAKHTVNHWGLSFLDEVGKAQVPFDVNGIQSLPMGIELY